MLGFFIFYHLFLFINTVHFKPPNGIFLLTKRNKKIPKRKGGDSMSWENFWQWVSHWLS